MELDCVFMFNFSDLKLFYVNQAAIKQLGYSHKELLQMSLLDINPDWTKKQAHQLLMPLMKGLQASLKIETIHQHKNTTLIQVEALFEYITIKDAFFVAKIRDITEHKRAKAQLQQAAQTEKNINHLIGPSPTEAAKLFNLVMSGNVKKILANVTELEQQHNELLPFAEQVKSLIKGFEMSELKKFIKQYIKE